MEEERTGKWEERIRKERDEVVGWKQALIGFELKIYIPKMVKVSQELSWE